MKKRSAVICAVILVLLLALLVTFFFVSRDGKKKGNGSLSSNSTEASEENVPDSTKKSKKGPSGPVTTLTWRMCDASEELQGRVGKLNSKLENDGINIRLKIKTDPDDDNSTYLENLSGDDVDIVSLGSDYVGETHTADFVKSGYLEKLDDILASGDGRKIYDSIPAALWDIYSTGKSHYVIPCTGANDSPYAFFFNHRYFDSDDLRGFDGSLESVEKLIGKSGYKGENGLLFDEESQFYLDIAGETCEYGLVFDEKNGEITDPFENDSFRKSMMTLKDMHDRGMVRDGARLHVANDNYTDDSEKAFVAGDYAVAVMRTNEGFQKKDSTDDEVYSIPHYIQPRFSGSVGISKSSPRRSDAVKLLSLLFTDEAYADTLYYGTKGEDYTVKDGWACTPDGKRLGDDAGCYLSDQVNLDLHLIATPGKDSDLVIKDKKAYDNLYQNIQASPFQGFHISVTEKQDTYNGAQANLDDFLAKYPWEDFDKCWAEHQGNSATSDALKDAQSQWNEYKTGAGS